MYYSMTSSIIRFFIFRFSVYRFMKIQLWLKIRLTLWCFKNPFINWNAKSELHLLGSMHMGSQAYGKNGLTHELFSESWWIATPHVYVKQKFGVFHYLFILWTLPLGCIIKMPFCPTQSTNCTQIKIWNSVLYDNIHNES